MERFLTLPRFFSNFFVSALTTIIFSMAIPSPLLASNETPSDLSQEKKVEASITKLLAGPHRPSISEVKIELFEALKSNPELISKFLAEKNPIENFNSLSDFQRINPFESVVTEGPGIIAQFEKLYPGTTFVGMGRDSAFLTDFLDAFYLSLNQNDRVKMAQISGPSFGDLDKMADYVLQLGFRLPPAKINRGFTFFDATNFNYNSQSRKLLRSVMDRCKITPNCKPEELLKRLSVINTGAVKGMYRQNVFDGSIYELNAIKQQNQQAGDFAAIPSVNIGQNLTYTNGFHDSFSGLIKDAETGEIQTTPGRLSSIEVRRHILWEQLMLIKLTSLLSFHQKTFDYAKNVLGYEFPIERVTTEAQSKKIQGNGVFVKLTRPIQDIFRKTLVVQLTKLRPIDQVGLLKMHFFDFNSDEKNYAAAEIARWSTTGVITRATLSKFFEAINASANLRTDVWIPKLKTLIEPQQFKTFILEYVSDNFDIEQRYLDKSLLQEALSSLKSDHDHSLAENIINSYALKNGPHLDSNQLQRIQNFILFYTNQINKDAQSSLDKIFDTLIADADFSARLDLKEAKYFHRRNFNANESFEYLNMLQGLIDTHKHPLTADDIDSIIKSLSIVARALPSLFAANQESYYQAFDNLLGFIDRGYSDQHMIETLLDAHYGEPHLSNFIYPSPTHDILIKHPKAFTEITRDINLKNGSYKVALFSLIGKSPESKDVASELTDFIKDQHYGNHRDELIKYILTQFYFPTQSEKAVEAVSSLIENTFSHFSSRNDEWGRYNFILGLSGAISTLKQDSPYLNALVDLTVQKLVSIKLNSYDLQAFHDRYGNLQPSAMKFYQGILAHYETSPEHYKDQIKLLFEDLASYGYHNTNEIYNVLLKTPNTLRYLKQLLRETADLRSTGLINAVLFEIYHPYYADMKPLGQLDLYFKFYEGRTESRGDYMLRWVERNKKSLAESFTNERAMLDFFTQLSQRPRFASSDMESFYKAIIRQYPHKLTGQFDSETTVIFRELYMNSGAFRAAWDSTRVEVKSKPGVCRIALRSLSNLISGQK